MFIIDDVFILILKYLNLNERAEVRLVSKKWKFFIDKLSTKKLAIFCNLPPTSGRFKLKHERFCFGDTVYVKNWDKFIKDAYVQRCLLKSVEKLVIQNSDKRTLNFYNVTFDRLVHLELIDVRIDEMSTFLEHNKIETLFLYQRDSLDYFRRDLDDLEKMERKFGFLKLLSTLKKLKHLSIRNKLTIEFFKNWKQILNKLERLDVHIKDVQCLLYINNEFPNLKILNAFVFESLDKFSSFLSPIILEKLRLKLRKNLRIYLYNVELTNQTIVFICDYLNGSKNQIRLCNSEMVYTVDETCNRLFDTSEKNLSLLDTFFKNINILSFQSPIFNETIFRLMHNVEYLNFSFKKDKLFTDFDKYLQIFNSLKELKLSFESNCKNGNEIISLLPAYCWNIFSLKIMNSNKENFDFAPLLQLKNLKYLKLAFISPLELAFFVKLIQDNNYLTYFEMSYDKIDGSLEDELLQQEVEKNISNVLKERKLSFRVQSQGTETTRLVVFCVLKLVCRR